MQYEISSVLHVSVLITYVKSLTLTRPAIWPRLFEEKYLIFKLGGK
jgi:hypothetical protein